MPTFKFETIDLNAPTPKPVISIEGNATDVTEEQKSYIAAANVLAISLQNDQAADTRAKLSEDLKKTRDAARCNIAAALQTEVSSFIVTPTEPYEPKIKDIRNRYEAELRKFLARPAAEDDKRFEDDFAVVEKADELTKTDQSFLDQVRKALSELADDSESDGKATDFSPGLLNARALERAEAAKAYRALVDNYQNATGEAAVEQLVLRRGRYLALRDRLKKRLFSVRLDLPAKADAQNKSEKEDIEPELHVGLKSGLPAPENVPSPDKLELYVQLYKTNTIMRAVYHRSQERSVRKFSLTSRKWFEGRASEKASDDNARRLHIEFLKKLKNVATIGLELDFTQLAKLTLEELRIEYFMLQAGRIKKQHGQTLAWVAAGLSFFFVVSYAIICWVPREGGPNTWNFFFWTHKNFLLAATGASIATWASFMARQVTFTFDDLVMLDESSLPAVMRVTFVIILTMAACLFFWTDALNIEIGGLKTKGDSFRDHGTIAFLIGLLCGFSERALATAITGRAAAFVRTVQG